MRAHVINQGKGLRAKDPETIAQLRLAETFCVATSVLPRILLVPRVFFSLGSIFTIPSPGWNNQIKSPINFQG